MVLINAVSLAPAVSSAWHLIRPLGRLGFVAADSFSSNSVAAALAGGTVLGAATIAKFRTNGNVLGVSGIVGGLARPGLTAHEVLDRLFFLAGLLIAGFVLRLLQPECLGRPAITFLTLGGCGIPRLIAAGGLVGYGTALGSGCTSGHGIFGNARFSRRSMVATGLFVAAGFASAALFCTTNSNAQSILSLAASSTWPPKPLTSAVMAGEILLIFGASITCVWKATKCGAVSLRLGQRFVDCLTGLMFGLALGLSGMANPSRVSKFFDLKSPDPTLAFVIGGALVVTAPYFATISQEINGEPILPPVLAEVYRLPSRFRPVDNDLITGALIFGAGWGLMGLCPAPALLCLGSSATWSDFTSIALFDSAMAVGWAIYYRFESLREWLRSALRKK